MTYGFYPHIGMGSGTGDELPLSSTGSPRGTMFLNISTGLLRFADGDGGFLASDARTPLYLARAASTANVTIATPGATIDGVTLAVGDVVLLKNQSSPAENGLYVFAGAASPMTRATNWATGTTSGVVAGSRVAVAAGTANAGTEWALATGTSPVNVGTTTVAFVRANGNILFGTGTIGGGGTVAIDAPIVANAVTQVTCTAATPHAISVTATSPSANTFTVTGTAADTFDWSIILP